MRVYISYSLGSSIAYCFWKYFFQSCGIWVSTQIIDKKWKLDKAKKPQLVILDNKNKERYEASCANIVYCMKKVESFREDFFKISKRQDVHRDILKLLFAGDERGTVLIELLPIFGGKYNPNLKKIEEEGLWSAMWLFHEIAQLAEKKEWDQEIYGKAEKAMEQLQSGGGASIKSWYHQYMLLYCQYLQCGVNRSSINRMYHCKALLEQCGRLSKERGQPALDFLAGKISLLTSTENKYAVSYFNKIIRYEPQADIYYEIGHVYEKAYGDYSMALKYYEWAYRTDCNYYRALYKFAAYLENSRNWREALIVYNEIRRIINCDRVVNSISIRDLEYDYKSCIKILDLYDKYMEDVDLKKRICSQIFYMEKHMDEYANFEKLFSRMFLTENQEKKKKEMEVELQKKINLNCCNEFNL